MFSAALSRALCLLVRQAGRQAGGRAGGPHPRILCLQHSPDPIPHYIPIMNTIFSAQVRLLPLSRLCVAGDRSGKEILRCRRLQRKNLPCQTQSLPGETRKCRTQIVGHTLSAPRMSFQCKCVCVSCIFWRAGVYICGRVRPRYLQQPCPVAYDIEFRHRVPTRHNEVNHGSWCWTPLG